ncbi:uncharacterized protein PG998_003651 [Apiospora kogelbergensis]|uniref:uncharacterized protein n=1 Tax=Apiospora kogelbergensis TaxID=1337665 RepID=UPI00312F3EB8
MFAQADHTRGNSSGGSAYQGGSVFGGDTEVGSVGGDIHGTLDDMLDKIGSTGRNKVRLSQWGYQAYADAEQSDSGGGEQLCIRVAGTAKRGRFEPSTDQAIKSQREHDQLSCIPYLPETEFAQATLAATSQVKFVLAPEVTQVAVRVVTQEVIQIGNIGAVLQVTLAVGLAAGLAVIFLPGVDSATPRSNSLRTTGAGKSLDVPESWRDSRRYSLPGTGGFQTAGTGGRYHNYSRPNSGVVAAVAAKKMAVAAAVEARGPRARAPNPAMSATGVSA